MMKTHIVIFISGMTIGISMAMIVLNIVLIIK